MPQLSYPTQDTDSRRFPAQEIQDGTGVAGWWLDFGMSLPLRIEALS